MNPVHRFGEALAKVPAKYISGMQATTKKEVDTMANNGDTDRTFDVDGGRVRGIGSFHKTLPHDEFGEVDVAAFDKLVQATRGDGSLFSAVPKGDSCTAKFTNPQAGLARDPLVRGPASFSMLPAPSVLSDSAAAEMLELYWMAELRDLSFQELLEAKGRVPEAIKSLNTAFGKAVKDNSDAGALRAGLDLPGGSGNLEKITSANLFRLGLPGEDQGPLISQFWLRQIAFGTQTLSQRQLPYKKGLNFLTTFDDWLCAQNTGFGQDGNDYSRSNEARGDYFEKEERYITTPRDLARFVNKDALYQAYLNAALIMLSGGAKWTNGNPYGDGGRLESREAGFGVLGGPHILALVTEIATRGLEVVWYQKWQTHLRLRPEAYGGLLHVQEVGVSDKKKKRNYGLPTWICPYMPNDSFLLPMAFTAGSPKHPAYGAGHATVAGACVTMLKAYFKTFEVLSNGETQLLPFTSLTERDRPFGKGSPIKTFIPSFDSKDNLSPWPPNAAQDTLTLEGELNKLASNVAMGRSMGGVHWRSDNSRSLVLGEAVAANILADLTNDLNEHPYFEFRTFARRGNGQPKLVRIQGGSIFVDGVQVDRSVSAL